MVIMRVILMVTSMVHEWGLEEAYKRGYNFDRAEVEYE